MSDTDNSFEGQRMRGATADVANREDVITVLIRMESKLDDLSRAVKDPRLEQDWYTTDEFAELVDKAQFTVREWCRHGRIHAEKRDGGRGAGKDWRISLIELQRYRNFGLLPSPHQYRHLA